MKIDLNFQRIQRKWFKRCKIWMVAVELKRWDKKYEEDIQMLTQLSFSQVDIIWRFPGVIDEYSNLSLEQPMHLVFGDERLAEGLDGEVHHTDKIPQGVLFAWEVQDIDQSFYWTFRHVERVGCSKVLKI